MGNRARLIFERQSKLNHLPFIFELHKNVLHQFGSQLKETRDKEFYFVATTKKINL